MNGDRKDVGLIRQRQPSVDYEVRSTDTQMNQETVYQDQEARELKSKINEAKEINQKSKSKSKRKETRRSGTPSGPRAQARKSEKTRAAL